ncbi:MAG: hypothetical protein K2Y35_05940 [Burkholderiales bacterium]|nr:hypothetical protein [Burkholderiales bacterium]
MLTLLAAGGAFACVEGDLRGEAVIMERDRGATAEGERTGLQVLGAGWFRAVSVVKKGGTTDDTTVTVELDGESAMSTSFAVAKNPWRQVDSVNLIVTVRTEGDTSTLTIWYPQELKFRALAQFRVEVQEAGVEDIRVIAIMNKPAPHEHIPGQPGSLASLPTFK